MNALPVVFFQSLFKKPTSVMKKIEENRHLFRSSKKMSVHGHVGLKPKLIEFLAPKQNVNSRHVSS